MKHILFLAFLLLLLVPPTPADWTWTLQTDVGNTAIRGMAALSASQVWGTGYYYGDDSGAIYFYDGSNWSIVTSVGSPRRMQDVTAVDSNNVWVVGRHTGGGTPRYGYIYYFNGSTWSLQTTINDTYLHAATSVDASNVWAGGRLGQIYYYNGSSWSLQTQATGYTIYGMGALDSQNAWAGTSLGRIYKYNGSVWSLQTATGISYIQDFAVLDQDHVWAVGYDLTSDVPNVGYIFFYNGSSWSVQTTMTISGPSYYGNMYGIHAISPNRVWAVGDAGRIYFFNGTSWTLQTDVGIATIYSVTGARSFDTDSVWAGASLGRIYHAEGRAIPEPSTALLLLLIAPGLLPFVKRFR